MLTERYFHHTSSGRKLWVFPRFAGDCANGHRKSNSGATSEQKGDITDSCSQMILQLHDVYNPNKVSALYIPHLSKICCSISFFHGSYLDSVLQINVKIKIVSGSPSGAVAAEASKAQASWVVLDK